MIQQSIFVSFVTLFCPIKIALLKIVSRIFIFAFLKRHNLRAYAPIALKFEPHVRLIGLINWLKFQVN